MNDEMKKILDMLEKGKISSAEAERLIEAVGAPVKEKTAPAIIGEERVLGAFKYLYVKITSTEKDNVDVRVPLSLVRAGMKLTSLIPPAAMDEINSSMKEAGITLDFNNLKDSDVEELIEGLKDMEINVTSANGDTVKVYCA
jgi:Asp-tRNA(Asn)/Glu-tRNA(Gln) amidotransferase B subunit